MTASSGASQGRSRARTWTPRSRVGTPTCTWQAQVPAWATTGAYRRASSRYRGWGVTAASPGVRYGATPEATSRQPSRAAAAAASRRSRVSSRPASSRLVQTPVAVSTWNRISSGRTPGSPPSIRTRSGPASTAAPVAGSSSTNSSSTPSVIASAARAVPRRPPGTVAARPAPPGPGLTAACCSGGGRSGRRWPSAPARPAAARAAGISGHSSAASVMQAAACTATAWAPASVTTCPAAVRVASGGCPAGVGGVQAIVWSFLPVRTRRGPPAMRLSRGAGQEAVQGLSLAAAAPGGSSPAMSTAAAAVPPRPGPGPGGGTGVIAGAGLSVCHPPGDTRRPDFV